MPHYLPLAPPAAVPSLDNIQVHFPWLGILPHSTNQVEVTI